MSQVNVNHLFKNYGDQRVLDDISFTIDQGETFGLIGPNGAGKTTLLDIIIGLERADAGQVSVGGLEVPRDIQEIRSSTGLVPQDIALLPGLDVRANLKYFGGLYGLAGKALNDRVEAALEAVGLTETGKKAVKTFSGGMQRRLNIAAAILHRPKFLILDEPTVGVDPQSRNKIYETIKQMNQESNTTVLYTSHYMEEVEALCDRVFIIDQGRAVAYGSQDEIKMMAQDTVKWQLEIAAAEVGLDQDLKGLEGVEELTVEGNVYHIMVDPLNFKSQRLLDVIQHKKLELKGLSRKDLSLEEAFLALTGKSLRD